MPSGACLYMFKSDESFMIQPARDGSPSGLNIHLILTMGLAIFSMVRLMTPVKPALPCTMACSHYLILVLGSQRVRTAGLDEFKKVTHANCIAEGQDLPFKMTGLTTLLQLRKG